MHLTHLTLANVRSFRQLELDLTPGLHVITGANGSGKSNLLEAIALLATTRSLRATNDLELIAWDALRDDPLPAARLAARIRTAEDSTQLEVVVGVRPMTAGGSPGAASRRFRVNGVARRASDLIGRLRVVLFSADDLGIIEGAPAARRRYLDITISQIDAAYVRAAQRYQRVLQQRNSLLRRLQERRARMDELGFWDEELAQAGAVLIAGRARAVEVLNRGAAERYAAFSTRTEGLEICYRPALPPPLMAATTASDLAARLRDTLLEEHVRDVQAGTTRVGPHRDDLAFLLGGHAAGATASRGELRGVALALRLAEVALSSTATGDTPVLLLDDVLSELDGERRARVLKAAFEVDQVVITSPDPDRPSRTELVGGQRYEIGDGALVSVIEGSRPYKDAALPGDS